MTLIQNLISDLDQTKFILRKFQVILNYVNYFLKMVKLVDAQPERKGLDDRGSSGHYLDYIQCQALFVMRESSNTSRICFFKKNENTFPLFCNNFNFEQSRWSANGKFFKV